MEVDLFTLEYIVLYIFVSNDIFVVLIIFSFFLINKSSFF